MKQYKFPEYLTELKDKFLEYRKTTQKLNHGRIVQLNTSICYLYEYMIEKGIDKIENITPADTLKFQHYIYKNKHLSTLHSITFLLQNLQSFCRYLYHIDLIWKNPFEKIKFVEPPEFEKIEIKRYYNFDELITKWTNWLKKKEYNFINVKHKIDSLRLFVSFLEKRGIKTVYKITPETIIEYKNYLMTLEYAPGVVYGSCIQLMRLRYACQFLLYLYRERLIKHNLYQYMNLLEYSKALDEKHRKTESINPDRHRPVRISDPEIKQLLEKLIQYKISTGGSSKTSYLYRVALEKFYSYMETKNITDLKKVTKRDIMDYQNWIYDQKTLKGEKYAPNTLLSFLIGLRSFFDYLAKYDYIVCDPASAIDMPKEEHGIPHTCMTEREIKILLEKPDTASEMGLRDRAVMEVLYSTGIRANELIHTKINDIDFTQGLLRVEEPKGGKSYQRIIPIGKTACEYVKMYLSKVRPLYNLNSDKGYIFLSRTGGKLVRGYLSCMIRKYLFHLGLRKKITAHSFRVSCATHMLLHNADIRYVQQQLGHLSIRTTQGYTRLVPKDLKAVHQRCHPRDKKFTETISCQE